MLWVFVERILSSLVDARAVVHKLCALVHKYDTKFYEIKIEWKSVSHAEYF